MSWRSRQQPWLPIAMPYAPCHAPGSGEARAWFAVRCVFARGRSAATGRRVYEERVTLWRATSVEEAVTRAETEARAYAATLAQSSGAWLGSAQAYRLPDEPRDGAELFSSSVDECARPHRPVGVSGAEGRT